MNHGRGRRRAAARSRPVTAPAPDPAPGAAEAALATAIEDHRAGRLRRAEAGYRGILKSHPDQFDALNLIGVVMHQTGRHEAAVEHIGKAVALKPEFAEAHSNLGNAFKELGRLDEAAAAHRRAIALKPDYAEAHHNLGVVLIRQGNFAEAVAACREAVALRPEFAAAHSNLGHALRGEDDLDGAVASYRAAIALEPEFAAAHYNLGNALKGLGKLDEAVRAYGAAIALKPGHAAAHSNLGSALTALGRFDEAVAAGRKAVALEPDHAEAHSNLGNTLAAEGKLDQAIAYFRKAIALRSDFAEAYNNLGEALKGQGSTEEAVAAYGKAIALKPSYAEAHVGLGVQLKAQGRLGEAVAQFRKAIALKPGHARARLHLGATFREQGKLEEARAAFRHSLDLESDSQAAYFALSTIETHGLDAADVVAMQALVDDAGAVEKDMTLVLFALAQAYEERHDYDRAFECFARGNRLRRRAVEFDIASAQDTHDRIAESFSGTLLSRLTGAGASSALPIFIVGMPRSGTTLVEQILASHDDVLGAGEIDDMVRVASGLGHRLGLSRPFPQCIAEVDVDRWREVGEAYAEALGRRAPSKSRISDKMPSNYQFIGLIHLMLPNASIIHCQRDPVDTCLSMYRMVFKAKSGPGFTYDLTELGGQYRLYDRLMRHWRAVLPGKVLDVRYEDVVADLEGSARRMVAHCGLEWNDACIDFHELDRPVRTLSHTQVRRPIYTTSIGRWRRYERHLEPLLRALGPCATRPEGPG